MKLMTVMTILTVLFLIMCFTIVPVTWVVNAYKLTQCDFKEPYKGEILHAAGLIPPICVITVFNKDK